VTFEPTPELLGRIADRLKALADPTRLAILHALEDGEHNVSEVLAAVGGSQANVSKHLARMRLSGILATRRDGTSVYYRVADPTAFAVCRTVCDALDSHLDSEREVLRKGRARRRGTR